MLASLAEQYPLVEQTFAEASEALGYDLWALVQNGPEEELNKTWQTQPALLAASVAIFRVWQQKNGKKPAIMAGHSLGEYSALVCAGVIDFKEAIKLVELRGKLMQDFLRVAKLHPAFFTAINPAVPSLLAPESNMAVSLVPKISAADSKATSMLGRL